MQTSTTRNIKKEHFPFELDVLLIGHNHDEAKSVEHFHKYTHEAIDDDTDRIFSGRIGFFLLSSL